MTTANPPSGWTKPIFPGFLYRNKITLFSAAPNTGKTRFALASSIKWANGEEWIGGQTDPLKILYCSERKEDEVLEQLGAMGILELPSNFRIFCPASIPYHTPMWDAWRRDPLLHISNWMKAEDFYSDIVVLDTFYHFVSHEHVNINDYGSNVRLLTTLRYWAGSINTAVLLVHHAGKERADSRFIRELDKSLGSQAIVAGCIAIWIMEPSWGANGPPEGEDHESIPPFLRLSAHSHMCPKPDPFYLNPQTFETCDPYTFQASQELTDLQREVLTWLDRPTETPTLTSTLANEVAAIYTKDRSNIYRTIRQLEKRGLVVTYAAEGTNFVKKISPLK